MANLDPYLFFDGNCAEAMRFYEQTLGGKLDLMKAGDSPAADEMHPDSAEKILHARLDLGNRAVMASDWMGGDQPYEGMKGFALAVGYTDVGDAQKVFDALAAGGKVNMPMQKTFWVESFGMLVDRFGTSWMVSGGKPAGA